MSITKRLKGYFLHGLAVLLPSIVTIWLFVWGYTFIQKNISLYINRGLVLLILHIQGKPGIPKDELTQIIVKGPASVIGFVIAVVAVCIFGAILASYVGKSIWRMAENFIMNTPLLRRVYPYIKQVTDFLLTQEEQKRFFSRVVAVEYPRKGIWTLGFVTGSGLRNVVNKIRKEFLTVLIPTSPTPFTGFIITVPKKQTIDLDVTIEEALRFIISGGVISPVNEMVKTDEQFKIDENLTEKPDSEEES
jgi:uncharacterized membrane protein